MLDFDRLRVLVAVADQGSMKGAAAALRCTQPGVSRQIATLERQVGAPLLTRTPRGTRLTAAGELLVEHARSVVERLSRAERQLAILGYSDDVQLRVGSFSSANASLMPQGLHEYVRRHPHSARPLLPCTDPEQHLAALRAGQLDLALVTEWDLHHQDLESIELVPLTEDRLLLALPSDHSLARRRIRLADLGDDTWIEGAHPDCLGPLEGLLGKFGHTPTVGIQCHDWTGKQALVATGAGIMFFPALALKSARPDIVLRQLDDEIPRRRVYIACPAGVRRLAPVRSMIEILQEVALRHGGA